MEIITRDDKDSFKRTVNIIALIAIALSGIKFLATIFAIFYVKGQNYEGDGSSAQGRFQQNLRKPRDENSNFLCPCLSLKSEGQNEVLISGKKFS